jgi:serine/threonine protein kinase
VKSPLEIASDRDAIVDQLAQLDLSDPADLSQSPEPPSTVRELKAQLDTLIGQLREPAGSDPFAEESGLRRAQELVRAIGVEYGRPAKDERLELGRIGPYELLAKLGEGGMGAVYKALHSSLEKVVALKVLPRERLHPDAIARFQREMKAVGKLDHPNIVRATDAGEAGGDHFLVMEYVDGLDLSQLLRRGGPLAAADACELVRQAAVGLQHAHQRGMVHRDIKPNNIMLTWGDEHAPAVKILDMGLALLSEPVASPHGDLTSTGQMMGTIEYMSPEQGLDTHNVDIRSDIYSLGATLYKLLCGKAPFSGERYNTPGKMTVALATEKPASIGTQRGDLPAGLVAVVDRMLAKNPAERFATPAEVAQALAPYAAGADLARLSATARQPAAPMAAAAGKLASTEEFLSSPNTGTQSGTPLRDVQVSTSPTAKAISPNASIAAPSPLLASLGKTAYFRPALIATAAALVFLAAATIIRIRTADGTLVLTVEDTSVIVEIDGQKAIVKPTKDGKALEISASPGDHTLVVKTEGGTVLKFPGQFTIEANGKTQLTAVLERGKPEIATMDGERAVAEWVLRHGGTVGGVGFQASCLDQLPAGRLELFALSFPPGYRIENPNDLAVFATLPTTKRQDLTMYVDSTNLDDQGLAHLVECKDITQLGIAGTNVTDQGLAVLTKLPRLITLRVPEQISDAAAKHLAQIKSLENLDLRGTQVAVARATSYGPCAVASERACAWSAAEVASTQARSAWSPARLAAA